MGSKRNGLQRDRSKADGLLVPDRKATARGTIIGLLTQEFQSCPDIARQAQVSPRVALEILQSLEKTGMVRRKDEECVFGWSLA